MIAACSVGWKKEIEIFFYSWFPVFFQGGIWCQQQFTLRRALYLLGLQTSVIVQGVTKSPNFSYNFVFITINTVGSVFFICLPSKTSLVIVQVRNICLIMLKWSLNITLNFRFHICTPWRYKKAPSIHLPSARFSSCCKSSAVPVSNLSRNDSR